MLDALVAQEPDGLRAPRTSKTYCFSEISCRLQKAFEPSTLNWSLPKNHCFLRMLDYTKRSSGLPLFNWPVPTGGAGAGTIDDRKGVAQISIATSNSKLDVRTTITTLEKGLQLNYSSSTVAGNGIYANIRKMASL